MKLLTPEGYDNIYNSVINKQILSAIHAHTYECFINIFNGTTPKEYSHEMLYTKIRSTIDKIKFIPIPVDIPAFNINHFLSQNHSIDEDSKQKVSENIDNLNKFLSNPERFKSLLQKPIVEAFGFEYSKVIERQGYLTMTGVEFDDFLDKVLCVINENTDSSSIYSPEIVQEKNIQIISQRHNIHSYFIYKYFSELKNSAGFCDQSTDDSIQIILNISGITSISTIIHEILHAIMYHKIENGYESGFNTDNTRITSTLRKYQIFNEIINEYFAQKILSLFTDEECKSFKISKNQKNAYSEFIYLIDEFLKNYEQELLYSLLSPNPLITLKELLGDKTIDSMNDHINKIYSHMQFRFYDNTSLLENLAEYIGTTKDVISLEDVVKNIDYLESVCKKDIYLAPFIQEIKQLTDKCNELVFLKALPVM